MLVDSSAEVDSRKVHGQIKNTHEKEVRAGSRRMLLSLTKSRPSALWVFLSVPLFEHIRGPLLNGTRSMWG